MRVHATNPLLPAGRLLALVLLAASLAGCGGGGNGTEDTNRRLVLVVDPTVLRDVNAAEFNSLLGDRLRTAVVGLPEDTSVDLLFVGLGQTGLPLDLRDSLPFDQYGTEEGHLKRAKDLGDTIAKLVQTRWAASNEQPNRPSSCILTALYRAQEMTKLGARRGENVTLVVVSDFLEACSETKYNFERVIPDSIGALPVEADLSGAGRVLMLRMQTSGAVELRDETRLIRLWTSLLKRWRVDGGAVEFTSNFPDSFVRAD